MSLRWFHLFFIGLTTLLFWGLAVVCFQTYKNSPEVTPYLIASLIGAVLGIFLLIYGILFCLKMKRLK